MPNYKGGVSHRGTKDTEEEADAFMSGVRHGQVGCHRKYSIMHAKKITDSLSEAIGDHGKMSVAELSDQ
ncbi:hypothetical protein QUF72_02825 [Desulfobacterales bacterium HSG2]|nr:hypothetical protein [Desulfobacterales bacterium HSG2]